MQNNPQDNQATSPSIKENPSSALNKFKSAFTGIKTILFPPQSTPTPTSWISTKPFDNTAVPTRLGKLIAQIYRDESMDEVEEVFQKVENARNRYENSNFLYKVLLPGPLLLVWNFKQLLNSNSVTRQLTQTLDPDYIALLLYSLLYGVSVISLLAIAVSFAVSFSLKSWNVAWWTITVFIFLGTLAIRVSWYDDIIKDTGFVRLYDDFRNAIAAQAEKARQFVADICDLYNKVNYAENESKVQRILDQIEVGDKENYRQLELKSMENLQALEASVAYAQVQDEETRKKLKNETELEYMAAKYQITGEGIQAQAHQITLALIQQEENILVSMAQALGTDEEKNREMWRHIKKETAILAALKGDLQRNGRKAFRTQEFEEGVEELGNTQAKRYKSTTGNSTTGNSTTGNSTTEK